MTLLGTLAKRSNPLENPQIPLSDPALVDWLNGGVASNAGVAVTETRAFGLTAYLRGISLLAGTMACLPLKVRQRRDRTVVTQQTVLQNPNPAQTPFEYWQTTYMNAIGWGNGYSRKVRDRASIVRELWPIHSSRVRVEKVNPANPYPDGKKFWVRDDDGREQAYSSWDIFHMPYLAPDGRVGLSPLQAARDTLGVAIAAELSAAKFYKNGSQLGGVLETDIDISDPKKADRLITRFKQKTQGPDHAHEVALLDNGTKFKPLTIPPVDAQLLESRKYGVTEIARMLGIPPHLLGDVEKSTSWGTGIEQQGIGFVVYTLSPWLTLTEQRVTRDVLPGGWNAGSWIAEYVVEGLLRGDSAARSAFYAQMIQWGVMTRNEVRALENLDPLEGLDEPLTPSNMTLVSVDGQYTPLGGTNAGTPAT